ncbi:unnamed protein product [Closterium sp. NIES-64]|nr:unnamed protein product [Closterium sp. NIES-64]
MGKPKARPASQGAGKGKQPPTQPGPSKAARPTSAGRMRQRLQGRAGPPRQTRQAAPKHQDRAQGQLRGSPVQSQSAGGNASTPQLPPPPPFALLAASPRSAPPAAPGTREAGQAHTTGVSSKSPRASRVARRGLGAHQAPRQEEEVVREVSTAAMGAAQGGCHTSTDGTTAETVLPGGSERAGAATGEHVTPRDAADADGGVGENDEAEIVSAAATGKPVVADADGPVVGTAADPAPAGGSAAAVDGGSASPAATPRAAQAEAEEMRPGAAPEQSAEVALSASPAPVTAAALAAAVSAAIGEHGDAPAEEGATTAAACAGTPAAVVAVSRQEHGQAEGEAPGPASGASSGAAHSRSKTRLRAQPAPRRPGAELGPGSPGPLLGWLLQGQSPSERAHRSSSSNLQEVREVADPGSRQPGIARGAPAPNATPATTAHAVAPNTTNAIANNTRRATRRTAITWGPPRGGRTPWLPAGRGAMGGGTRAPTGGGRTQRGFGARGARGGRGGRALVGGSEIPARTGTWRERHDRPGAVEVPTNEGQPAGSDDNASDPEFMCSEEADSEEVSLEEETGVARNAPNSCGRGLNGTAQNQRAVGDTAEETEGTDVFSPYDMVKEESIWQGARGLEKFPTCLRAWKILLFLPRLTLRPSPEPVAGLGAAGLELRLGYINFSKGTGMTFSRKPEPSPIQTPRYDTNLTTKGFVHAPKD